LIPNQNEKYYDLITVGGGAAGFFGSIVAAHAIPEGTVLILEKTSKLLSKVKVSGGGRCNVTHHCFEPSALARHYPRGAKQLKSLFRKFQASDMINWFESKKVKLKTEDDGRIFPTTNNSQTIIDCFLSEAERLKILIKLNTEVTAIEQTEHGFNVWAGEASKFQARNILIAPGGYNKAGNYDWIRRLSHPIVEPIASLFTFNDSEKRFTDLMGVSVPHAEVKIAGTKFSESGPVLITHWGLSGPAVIKLSAWAAHYLYEQQYTFTVLVNWINKSEEELKSAFATIRDQHPKLKITSKSMFDLPMRLWLRICELVEIPESKIWSELSLKSLNKLMEYLIRCPFQIKGKTTFKEEFVTCGGVDLKSIDLETMESRETKGLYFAGEVLNIDGETGGFNFQSAWTTAWVAAQSIASKS
jgi:predicted Rossmann fold flavoprotein